MFPNCVLTVRLKLVQSYMCFGTATVSLFGTATVHCPLWIVCRRVTVYVAMVYLDHCYFTAIYIYIKILNHPASDSSVIHQNVRTCSLILQPLPSNHQYIDYRTFLTIQSSSLHFFLIEYSVACNNGSKNKSSF